MSQSKIDMIMGRYEQRAILPRRPYPPVDIPPVYSQLGGLPDLLDQATWPRGNDGTPLHFLARIDCSELPEVRGPLPAAGILQFFARIDEEMDWRGGSKGHSCVLHFDTRIGAPTSPPEDLPPIEGGWHSFDREMRLPTEPKRKVFPHWPLVFESIRTWPILAPFDPSFGLDRGDYLTAVARARAAEIVRTTGWPIKAPLGPRWGHTAFDKEGSSFVALPERPFSGRAFPQAWILIDRIGRAMACLASKEKEKLQAKSGDATPSSETDPAKLLSDFHGISSSATAWVHRAALGGLDEPTTEEVARSLPIG